jgi:hypothetical protein
VPAFALGKKDEEREEKKHFAAKSESLEARSRIVEWKFAGNVWRWMSDAGVNESSAT